MDIPEGFTLVKIEFLTDLLNVKREHAKVCKTFSIQENRQGEAWVGDGINERIKTLFTSYTMRKSIIEKGNGAALQVPQPPALPDPAFGGQDEQKAKG